MQAYQGLCEYVVLPLRAEPSYKSEMVSQVIFGETYRVLEEINEEWLRIELAADGYEGFLDRKNFCPLAEPEAGQATGSFCCAQSIALLHRQEAQKGSFPIFAGCSLPGYSPADQSLLSGKYRTEGLVRDTSAMLERKDFFSIAALFLYSPYLWGGKSPLGIDCSGFVQQVFKIAGYTLKRDAWQQALQGKDLRIEETQSGDLAFFPGKSGRIIHVGLILEARHLDNFLPLPALKPSERLLMHAYDAVRIDLLRSEGIWNLDKQFYSHRHTIYKRLF